MADRFWKRHFTLWILLIFILFIVVFSRVYSKQLQRQEQMPYLVGIVMETRFTEYKLPGGKRRRMIPHRDFFFQLKDQPNRLLRLNELRASEWKEFEEEIKHKHAMRLQYDKVVLDGEKQFITVINAENEHWQLKDFATRRKFFNWVTIVSGLGFVWLMFLLRKDYKTIKTYVGIESVHRSHHSQTHHTNS